MPVPAPAVEPAVAMESELPAAKPLPAAEVQWETEVLPDATPEATPFTVRVMPLESRDADPTAKAVLETFYAAFLGNLRAVPGLFLEVDTVEKSAVEQLPDFEISVRGGRTGEGKFGFGVAGDDKRMLEAKQRLPNLGGAPRALPIR